MTWRPASSTLCKYIATYSTYWGCEKLRLLNSFYRRTRARKLPLSENGRKEKDSAEAVVWKRRGEKFVPVNAVFRFFLIEPTDGLFFLENLPNSSSLFTTFSSMGNPLPAVLRYEPAQAPTRIGGFRPFWNLLWYPRLATSQFCEETPRMNTRRWGDGVRKRARNSCDLSLTELPDFLTPRSSTLPTTRSEEG